jgi:zinc protease
VSEKELDDARQGWLNSRQTQFIMDAALAGTLAANLQRGRTMGYYSELESKVRSLTPEQVTSTFKKYIDPKKLIIVEGGDLKSK